MRRLLLPFALLALLALFGPAKDSPPGARAADLFSCYGAPSDYVAQFDSIDGAVDGQVSYPEPRAFLEAQGQVAPSGVTARNQMEHIHIGSCVPYAEVIKQPQNARTLDVRYVFHNVSDYMVTKANTNWVSVGSSGHGYAANAAQLVELQAALDASADGRTTQVYQHYFMSSTFGANCRKTVKFVMEVVAANSGAVVNTWSTGGQFTTEINYPENATTCSPEYSQHQIRGRDWVPDPNMGYIYTTVFPLPASQMGDPVAKPWLVNMAASGMVAEVAVDPNNHVSPDYKGIWYDEKGQLGVESFTETVPTDTFPSGSHRLVFYGDRHPTDIGHTSLIVMPFTVAAVCQ